MKVYKITDDLSPDYETITPIYGVSKTSGTNLAWTKTLIKITEDYYEKGDLFPILVLEDDANQIRPIDKFDTPKECDIIYYGISSDTFGEKERYSIVENYPHLVKLKKMASTHAVCFYNINSVQKALELVAAALCCDIKKGGVPVDLMWSFELIPLLNVYALKRPVFVQGTCEKDNIYYENTNIVL